MKEIETILVLPAKDIAKRPGEYSIKFEDLYRNPDFFNQVQEIRNKFKLPARGIEKDLRLIQEIGKKKFYLPGYEIKPTHQEEDRFSKVVSLLLGPEHSRSLGIKHEHKNKHIFPEFQKHISILMKNFDLPERFRDALGSYIIYNKFPTIGPHLCRCLIKVFDDKGVKRLFIEVFGDTKEQDLRQAGMYIEAAKTQYKIRGKHLFRYKDYYKHKLITADQVPVDAMGMPVAKDNINDLLGFQKNIYKSRHRKYLKKNYSK